MKKILKQKWLRVWIILITLSPLVSFIGAYAYFYVLALLYPLAQTIAIRKINESKWPVLWLIHCPFWMYVFSQDYSTQQILIAILINSLLGEVLLAVIFRKFGYLIWFICNSIGLALIYGGIKISGTNDFIQIIALILSYSISALITGLGIEYGYRRSKKINVQSILIIITSILIACNTGSQSEKNDVKFDSDQWKTGNMRTKGRMTDHLLNDSLLIGKTKNEVLEMLGEPDQQTQSRFHYTVDPGIQYMNEPWTYWLTVDFDTTEHRVQEVRLHD